MDDTTDSSRSDDAAERRARVALAGRRGEIATVRAHLDDPDASVRAGALAALIGAGAASADEVLAVLYDEDAGVRRAALEHGARLPRVDLRPLLKDPDARVVEAAAFAAGEFEDDSCLDELIAVAAAHDDPLARESAVAALGSVGDEAAVPTLLAALGDVAAIRRRAVVALSAFDSDEIAAALRERLDDRDWQVRQAAEEVLGLSDDRSR